jgi:hypothetical protein
MVDPTTTSGCGHSACLDCQLQWFEHNQTCPKCRERVPNTCVLHILSKRVGTRKEHWAVGTAVDRNIRLTPADCRGSGPALPLTSCYSSSSRRSSRRGWTSAGCRSPSDQICFGRARCVDTVHGVNTVVLNTAFPCEKWEPKTHPSKCTGVECRCGAHAGPDRAPRTGGRAATAARLVDDDGFALQITAAAALLPLHLARHAGLAPWALAASALADRWPARRPGDQQPVRWLRRTAAGNGDADNALAAVGRELEPVPVAAAVRHWRGHHPD